MEIITLFKIADFVNRKQEKETWPKVFNNIYTVSLFSFCAENRNNVICGSSCQENINDNGGPPRHRLRIPPNYVFGELAAAGWPSWLVVVAGEALKGCIPLKADTFNKFGKACFSNIFISISSLLLLKLHYIAYVVF